VMTIINSALAFRVLILWQTVCRLLALTLAGLGPPSLADKILLGQLGSQVILVGISTTPLTQRPYSVAEDIHISLANSTSLALQEQDSS